MNVQRLEELNALSHAHPAVAARPSWEEVTADCAATRARAAYLQTAVDAGLMADVVDMTAVDSWPSDVREAMAHLGNTKYDPTTMHGILAHMSGPGRGGLVNDIKGTVLAQHAVDAMNAGKEPIPFGGDHVALAGTTNQPGFDAVVTKGDIVVGHLQMKATDNLAYLREHLHRYPQYPDLVTTHEVAESAASHGLGAHVIDSGITNGHLTDHVQDAVEHLSMSHAVHELVPEFAIAAIMVTAAVKIRRGEDAAEVKSWIKEQATTAGLANLAGAAVQVATGTVVLRPIAAIGARFTVARGKTATQLAARARDLRGLLPVSPVALGTP